MTNQRWKVTGSFQQRTGQEVVREQLSSLEYARRCGNRHPNRIERNECLYKIRSNHFSRQRSEQPFGCVVLRVDAC